MIFGCGKWRGIIEADDGVDTDVGGGVFGELGAGVTDEAASCA